MHMSCNYLLAVLLDCTGKVEGEEKPGKQEESNGTIVVVLVAVLVPIVSIYLVCQIFCYFWYCGIRRSNITERSAVHDESVQYEGSRPVAVKNNICWFCCCCRRRNRTAPSSAVHQDANSDWGDYEREYEASRAVVEKKKCCWFYCCCLRRNRTTQSTDGHERIEHSQPKNEGPVTPTYKTSSSYCCCCKTSQKPVRKVDHGYSDKTNLQDYPGMVPHEKKKLKSVQKLRKHSSGLKGNFKDQTELELQVRNDLTDTVSHADISRLQIELEKAKKEAAAHEQQFKIEMEAVMHATKQITIERDELLAKVEHLNNVNGK